MDLSKLSDEDLARMEQGLPPPSGQAPSQFDFSGVSDEELERIANGGEASFDDRLSKVAGQAPDVLNEMHPDIDVSDRLLVKNFGNNNEAAVNFLQKKKPELQFQVNDSTGEILARRRDGSEKSWRKLDPDNGIFSKDSLMDIGDASFDIAAGFGESAAAAAGAVAGAAGGMGIGAIPGAMAGGAVAGTGIEALRQLVGKGIGVSDEMSGTDIALSGAFGAASPLLMGAGMTVKQAAKAGVKETGKGLAGWVKDAALNKGFGPAVKDFAYDKVTPFLGAAASGIPVDTVKHMRANPGLLKDIEAEGLLNRINRVTGEISETAIDKSSAQGKKVKDFFGHTRNISDDVAGFPSDASLKDISVEGENLAELFGHRSADETAEQLLQAVQVDVSRVRQPFDELLVDLTDTASRSGTPKDQAKIEYVQGLMNEYFQKPYLDGATAWNLKKDLDNLGELFKPRNGTKPTLPKGAEYIDKEVIRAAGKASKAAREELLRVSEAVVPGGGQWIDNQFKTYNNMMRQRDFLDQFVSDPEKSYRNLNNLLNDSRVIRKERVGNLDADLAGKVMDSAEDLAAYKAFTGSFLPISSQGTVSTSRTIPAALAGAAGGYWLGANSGIGQGGAGVGGFAGGALGSLLGGPRMLRAYMAAGRAAGGTNKALTNAGIRPMQQIIPWMHMQNRKQPDEN